MRVSSRTYPQPDSPQPNIGPRERALAVFKYLLNMEPELAIKHPRFQSVAALYIGWEDEVPTPEAAAGDVVVDLIGTGPVDSLLFAAVVHSFEQAARAKRGEELQPSKIELRSQ